MRLIVLLILISSLLACSTKSDLDTIVQKHSELKTFVDSLKTSNRTFKKCSDCTITYLEGTKLTGFSERVPPKMDYYAREIELGDFKYDTFSITTDKKATQSTGKVFFCYFNPKQKAKFAEFFPLYANKISHYKEIPRVTYVNNIVIITIKNMEF